ncbi:CYTH domain-containing protein [Mesonia maritima]|uniref:Adenylate cyclase n=1 Tax=Mesonia maritima TaxID=1793873 RepID=A0ABU1K2Y4_9FLAO|nr:CYTH domain-containing protein [Mesonia maritima]MDR6299676.1 adenylate cyclase [Mesonia maritima]
MQEIERKFLVTSEKYKKEAFQQINIQQAYLNSHPERTTRIRIKNNEALITVKGKSSANGLTRFEWEKQIEVNDAKELLKLCEPGKIEKTRFLVKSGKHVFEVDEFYAENEGLTIAEVELKNENENVILPDWIGEEVTREKKYYNSSLINHPYKNWEV